MPGRAMTWTKIGDDYFDRIEVLELSRDARILDLEATEYSNRNLSDGRVPAAAQRRSTDSPDVDMATTELVKAGLWEITPDGWQIADWTEAQETADQVRRRQQVSRDRQTRHRMHREGDHSLCDSHWCRSASNGVTNSVTDGVSNDTPSRPVPSGPDPTGGTGQGRVTPLTRPPVLRPGAATATSPTGQVPFTVTEVGEKR
jgi:hypothetical protein